MGPELELKGVKMQRIKYLLVLLLVIAFDVAAEIPNTFKPNTKALANEVNENFDSLDMRIKSVEACSNTLNGIQFTHNEKKANLGTQFIIGDYTYTLIKIIIPDIVNGDFYEITLPSFRLIPSYQIVNPSQFCATSTISGYPSDNNRLSIIGYMTYDTGGRISNQTTIIIKKLFKVLLGNVLVEFKIQTDLTQQNGVFFGPPNFDYSTVYDRSLLVMPNDIIQQMDDMIDYIIINKLP